MSEIYSEKNERAEGKAPTLDQFGDIDQALGWIFERMYEKFSLEGIQHWWQSEWVSNAWRNNPNKLLQSVYDETK